MQAVDADIIYNYDTKGKPVHTLDTDEILTETQRTPQKKGKKEFWGYDRDTYEVVELITHCQKEGKHGLTDDYQVVLKWQCNMS